MVLAIKVGGTDRINNGIFIMAHYLYYQEDFQFLVEDELMDRIEYA